MSIKLENVSYVYEKGTSTEYAALKNVDLEIEKGEICGNNRSYRFRKVNTYTAF